jgi:hypothetical protein
MTGIDRHRGLAFEQPVGRAAGLHFQQQPRFGQRQIRQLDAAGEELEQVDGELERLMPAICGSLLPAHCRERYR